MALLKPTEVQNIDSIISLKNKSRISRAVQKDIAHIVVN